MVSFSFSLKLLPKYAVLKRQSSEEKQVDDLVLGVRAILTHIANILDGIAAKCRMGL